MSETKTLRLASAAKELNVGIATIVEHLQKNGFPDIDSKPNTKLSEEQYNVLLKDFSQSIAIKEKAEQLNIGKRKEDEEKVIETKPEEEVVVRQKVEVETPKVIRKIDLDGNKPKKEETKKATTKKKEEVEPEKTTEVEKIQLDIFEDNKIEEKTIEVEEVKQIPVVETPVEDTVIKAEAEKLSGPKILGKISLKEEKSPEQIYRKEEKQRKEDEKKKEDAKQEEKKKRARIHANKVDVKTFEKTNPGKTDGFRKDNRRGSAGKTTKETTETVIRSILREQLGVREIATQKIIITVYHELKRQSQALAQHYIYYSEFRLQVGLKEKLVVLDK